MSFEVDAIVIGEGSEAGSFEVLPGASESSIALPSSVQAVSIFREEFVANEKVTIIENNGQYGIAKKAAGLKGCIGIPDISVGNIFLENPAQAAAAYIGRMAGNYRTTYAVGTVKAIVGDKISVEYFDGTKTLGLAPVMSIAAADFAVDDLVLVNLWEYNQHLVCGWWQLSEVQNFINLWDARVSITVADQQVYYGAAANVDLKGGSASQPVTDTSSSLFPYFWRLIFADGYTLPAVAMPYGFYGNLFGGGTSTPASWYVDITLEKPVNCDIYARIITVYQWVTVPTPPLIYTEENIKIKNSAGTNRNFFTPIQGNAGGAYRRRYSGIFFYGIKRQ